MAHTSSPLASAKPAVTMAISFLARMSRSTTRLLTIQLIQRTCMIMRKAKMRWLLTQSSSPSLQLKSQCKRTWHLMFNLKSKSTALSLSHPNPRNPKPPTLCVLSCFPSKSSDSSKLPSRCGTSSSSLVTSLSGTQS